MQSDEIRNRFLKFFESKGHKIFPSSSLVPNDPSVLFTTAGMQQFKPYYINPELAERDLGCKNIATVQKCVRTGDIDEVGDNTHLTFFEMLGNFSFGGYGRKEAIEYAHEFITKEMGLEISYVTVYRGEGVVPCDEESKNIWKIVDPNLEVKEEGADVFWGPTGDSGPCGPTTEIYCKNASDEDVEIWNIVFNEYFCDGSREQLDKGGAKLTKLPVLGIDTGMGFERLVSIVQKRESVYETDVFEKALNYIHEYLVTKDKCSIRIITDHVRTATFLLFDGVFPGNKERGSVLRRLIAQAIINGHQIGFEQYHLEQISRIFVERYSNIYFDISDSASWHSSIFSPFKEEEMRFEKNYAKGIREIEKNPLNELTAEFFFNLHQTYGFPFELSIEEVNKRRKKKGLTPVPQDISNHFQGLFEKHQKLSQTASAGMFKGGLANHNEKTIKLHTAHHLLLAGLQAIVSKDIKQKGSNITEERLRMDFICDHKLTEIEKKNVEDWVNDKIKRNLNVVRREMPLVEAEKIGAQMEFGTKYPEIVSVYFVEDENSDFISKEFCGGPHVSKTGELGQFKIQKEEAVSAGVRRIKAILI